MTEICKNSKNKHNIINLDPVVSLIDISKQYKIINNKVYLNKICKTETKSYDSETDSMQSEDYIRCSRPTKSETDSIISQDYITCSILENSDFNYNYPISTSDLSEDTLSITDKSSISSSYYMFSTNENQCIPDYLSTSTTNGNHKSNNHHLDGCMKDLNIYTKKDVYNSLLANKESAKDSNMRDTEFNQKSSMSSGSSYHMFSTNENSVSLDESLPNYFHKSKVVTPTNIEEISQDKICLSIESNRNPRIISHPHSDILMSKPTLSYNSIAIISPSEKIPQSIKPKNKYSVSSQPNVINISKQILGNQSITESSQHPTYADYYQYHTLDNISASSQILPKNQCIRDYMSTSNVNHKSSNHHLDGCMNDLNMWHTNSFKITNHTNDVNLQFTKKDIYNSQLVNKESDKITAKDSNMSDTEFNQKTSMTSSYPPSKDSTSIKDNYLCNIEKNDFTKTMFNEVIM